MVIKINPVISYLCTKYMPKSTGKEKNQYAPSSVSKNSLTHTLLTCHTVTVSHEILTREVCLKCTGRVHMGLHITLGIKVNTNYIKQYLMVQISKMD